MLVEGRGGEARHLVHVQQLALPRELPVPRPLPGVVVDPQLEPSVQVVLVLGHAFQDPEAAFGEGRGDGSPGDARPPLHLEARGAVVVGRDGAPAANRERPPHDLAGDAVRIDEAEPVLVAGDLPGEVLGLAVEEEAVVLARIGAEEAVGAVGGRHGAHAPERGHVGPVHVALGRILVAIAERGGALQVGRARAQREELEEEVVGVRGRRVLPRLSVVVEEADVLNGRAVEARAPHPGEQHEVPAVAAGVVGVVDVPQHLVPGVRIVLPDVRERQARDVVGPFASRLVDGGLVLVEHEMLGVPPGRLLEAIVPAPARVRELDDGVPVVPVLVVPQDLGRQEVLRLFRRRPLERRSGGRRSAHIDRRQAEQCAERQPRQR